MRDVAILFHEALECRSHLHGRLHMTVTTHTHQEDGSISWCFYNYSVRKLSRN